MPAGRSPIIPVMAGDVERAVALSGGLWEQGILVPAIRPPTVPRGTSRLRISLTCGHTKEQVERLVERLSELRGA